MKIVALRTLFREKLSHLYDKREIEAIFFEYLEGKFLIKKVDFFLQSYTEIEFEPFDLEILSKGTPIQYLTEKTTFHDLQLMVNPSVLIPRPETEELVNLIISEHRKSHHLKSHILDIGTGSGAIAIALARKLENVVVWATDISEKALEIAASNAKKYQVEISFLHHDILHNSVSLLPENVDIIVSNPPYIPESEKSRLHINVLEFEPEVALFVPNEKPLIFYDAIAKAAKKILRGGGILYFETYEKYHVELYKMLAGLDFKEIKLLSDLSSKPRFICCKKS
ncbi:MAG: peptide chain release factor N(5)-glutamine methyltransferase [Bacteroidales bacterium]|nr:peptide chain release factor N(5)-glutamine methyltransferase [Bacteroidales bacterium]